jgi:DNA-binding SARP family transcriptional activator
MASRAAPGRRAASAARVVLLGAPHLIVAGKTLPFVAPPRTLPLLALLALARAPLARERVAAALWPDADDATARGNVRRHLYQLAKALPPAPVPYISASGTTLSWNAASCEVDAVRFEQLLDAAKWDDALSLYRGDLLPGYDDEWLIAERERLHERFLGAALEALRAARAKADFRAVLALGQRILAVDAWHEDAFRAVLAAKYELGDRAGALAEYDAFVVRLEAELGVEPTPETAALAEIIRQERSVSSSSAHSRTKARTAFRGRDAELAQLGARWDAVRAGGATVVVSGEAGIGKSRLVAEFATQVAAQGGRALAGGTSAVEARPYQAVVEVLRAAVPTLVALEPAPHWLAPLSVLVPEIAAHRTSLARPVPLDPARERTRLFDAVVDALAELARSRPLLVVLEDLHWARANTIDLAEFLVRRAPGLPLLVVVTLRAHEGDDAARRFRDLRGD